MLNPEAELEQERAKETKERPEPAIPPGKNHFATDRQMNTDLEPFASRQGGNPLTVPPICCSVSAALPLERPRTVTN
jgi:hypothetical protein